MGRRTLEKTVIGGMPHYTTLMRPLPLPPKAGAEARIDSTLAHR